MHYGIQDDVQAVNYQYSFGQKTNFGEPLGHIMKAQNLNGLADKFNDIREG